MAGTPHRESCFSAAPIRTSLSSASASPSPAKPCSEESSNALLEARERIRLSPLRGPELAWSLSAPAERTSLEPPRRRGCEKNSIDIRHFKAHKDVSSGIALILLGGKSRENLIAVAQSANDLLSPEIVRAVHAEFVKADVIVTQLEIPLPAVKEAASLATRDAKAIPSQSGPGARAFQSRCLVSFTP